VERALVEHQAKRPDHLAFKLRSPEEQRAWVAWCDRKEELKTALELARRELEREARLPKLDPSVRPDDPALNGRPWDRLEALVAHLAGSVSGAAEAVTARDRDKYQKACSRANFYRSRIKAHCRVFGLRLPELQKNPAYQEKK
jgi:hypothetical protein